MRALAVAFLVIAVTGCRKNRAIDDREPQPSASTNVQIANTLAGCEDTEACARACDAGNAGECMRLATSYEFGSHATKDEAHATALFVQACAMKSAPSCVSAGQMYEYHHGVAKDDARAAGYYKDACDLGYAAGCANEAIMLENGRGVARDEDAAKALYDRACAAGAGLACDRARALRKVDSAP